MVNTKSPVKATSPRIDTTIQNPGVAIIRSMIAFMREGVSSEESNIDGITVGMCRVGIGVGRREGGTCEGVLVGAEEGLNDGADEVGKEEGKADGRAVG